MLMNQSDMDARMQQHTRQVEMVNTCAWRDQTHSAGSRPTRPASPRARLGSALIALGSRLSADATA